jgi:peptidylprolyl isomerase
MIQFLSNFFSKIKRGFFSSFLITALSLVGADSARAETTKAEVIHLELKDGTVVIRPLPEVAPRHVERILTLVKEGFYDGIVFHRVIEGFMAQTGDPTGTGAGGSGVNLQAEFSDKPHKRGIVSMARASSPHSADSQFFIMLADAPYLDGQYTVWGEVIEGMEHVDRIKKGETHNNGAVNDPDKIIKMTVQGGADN